MTAAGLPGSSVEDLVGNVGGKERLHAFVGCAGLLVIALVPHIAEFCLHCSRRDRSDLHIRVDEVMTNALCEGIDVRLCSTIDAATCDRQLPQQLQ